MPVHPRHVAPLLLVGLLQQTTGCHDCSSAGCNDGMTIILPDRSLSPGRELTFHVCIDQQCNDGSVGGPQGVECKTDAMWCSADLLTSSITITVGGATTLGGSGSHAVTFRLSEGMRAVAHVEQQVEFHSFAPNGDGCPPVCHNARIAATSI